MDTRPAHLPTIRDLPAAALEGLGRRSIFFGHQSVGYNLVEGLDRLTREHPDLRLQIAYAPDPTKVSDARFVHATVGRNRYPDSKMAAFTQYLTHAAKPFDIAFFKFCYLDITAGTDVQAVFSQYEKTMAALEQQFPSTTFVHVTVPVTMVGTGPKAFLKRLLGRSSDDADNRRRAEYNALLRARYAGKEPLFDLVLAESTGPDGRTLTWSAEGAQYASLVPAYTDDGEHLNPVGQKRCAEQLVVTLANIGPTLRRR